MKVSWVCKIFANLACQRLDTSESVMSSTSRIQSNIDISASRPPECVVSRFGRIHTNIDLSVSRHLRISSSVFMSSHFYILFSHWSSFMIHMNTINAMNIERVRNICRVSHVTITVLSSNKSAKLLYKKSILTLFPCDDTHYNDT